MSSHGVFHVIESYDGQMPKNHYEILRIKFSGCVYEPIDQQTMYYNNGVLHRDIEPAIIFGDGDKEWYQNGLLHRDNDLPAQEWGNKVKELSWYKYGNLHRIGAPASINASDEEYFYEGVYYTPEDYWNLPELVKYKFDSLNKLLTNDEE